jgi:long-chain fatty acid transport protein
MKPITKSFHPIINLGLVCSVFTASAVQASGFALIEQSASAQGLSYAGAAIMQDDASVMWFNPAQMTQIQDRQLIGAVHFISPKVKFVDQGTGTGGGNSDGGNLGIVPNFYWKSQVNDLHLGLGINVPYGQHLDYGESWVGRYHATETNLTTLQINPNIAYQFNQAWSVGFGLNAQYVDVLLAQKINQSLLGQPDGNAEVTGDNWAYGYNFGLSYHPENAIQVGFSYRSGFSHKVKGKVRV